MEAFVPVLELQSRIAAIADAVLQAKIAKSIALLRRTLAIYRWGLGLRGSVVRVAAGLRCEGARGRGDARSRPPPATHAPQARPDRV